MWRQANPGDQEEIISMCMELNREDPGIRPVPPSYPERTIREIQQNPVRGKIFVLDVESAVQGYALLMSYWSNELGGEICYLDELFVRSEFRGRGFGGQLIRDFANRTGEYWSRDCVAIDLEVTPDNAKARKLYQSLGFTPWKNTMMRLRF